MKRLQSILAGVTAGTLLLAGPVLAGKADNSLRVAMENPLPVIDPYYSQHREVYAIIGEMMFDTLIYEDLRTGAYEPLLATEWEWVDDVTLVMKLREGVVWHDGEPFTADDVVYTFDYILDPENATARYDQYNMIAGAEKLGEHEVQITLIEPYGPIMPTLAARIQILPKGFYGADRTPTRLVGTGPYELGSYTSGAGATLTLTGEYFDGSPKGQPVIETFEYVYIPEGSTQIAELMVGNIDWVWRVSNEDQARLATVSGLATAQADTLRTHYLYFDAINRSGVEAFSDVRVRQAVFHAIDRDTIARELVRGGEAALNQPCHPDQFGCPPAETLTQYEYNPDRARELLAEAGYPDGFSTDMWFFSNYQRELAQAMQSYLLAVGINVNLRPATSTVLYEGTGDGTVPMAWVGTAFGSILDVSALWSASFGTQRDLTQDDELTEWVQQGDVLVDSARRLELYEQVAQRIMDEAYWVPLWVEGGLYVYNEELDYPAWGDENPRFYFASWKD